MSMPWHPLAVLHNYCAPVNNGYISCLYDKMSFKIFCESFGLRFNVSTAKSTNTELMNKVKNITIPMYQMLSFVGHDMGNVTTRGE